MPAVQNVEKQAKKADLDEKNMFLEEARQLLDKLIEILPTLTVDSIRNELEEIYLIYHTLKGNSRMIGQQEMQDLFHALGMLVLDIKDFGLAPDETCLELFRGSAKVISYALNMFAAGRIARKKMSDFREQVIKVSIPPEQKNITKQVGQQEKYFKALGIDDTAHGKVDFSDSSSRFYEIAITLDENVFLKKTRVYTIIRNFALQDETVKFGIVTPPIEDLLAEKFGLDFTVLLQSRKTSDQLQDIVHLSSEIARVNIRILSTQDAIKVLKK